MALIRGRERKDAAAIFTASMADIVFLLIVFFVLTYKVEVDKTQMNLPETLSADFIDAQYRRWKSDPSSLSDDWQFFFKGFEVAGSGEPPAGAAAPFCRAAQKVPLGAATQRPLAVPPRRAACARPTACCGTAAQVRCFRQR